MRNKPLSKKQAKRWVEALRSGDYNQTTGDLKDPWGCHCCLGVLAEVEELTKPIADKRLLEYPNEDWSAPVVGRLTTDDFVDFNDVYRKDFLYIADKIEAELERMK